METDKIKALKEEKGVVFVEFYATWCPHCQKMMPVVDDVKALFEGRAKVYQFDIDLNGEFANDLDVKSIPTFIIFKDGKEVWRTVGETAADVLSRKLDEALQS
ncbi:MAG: thioredoxin family protein [Muribaculaceae bacterium]|nr:thioredoxin family protein [Muribaculaceae bacterium]